MIKFSLQFGHVIKRVTHVVKNLPMGAETILVLILAVITVNRRRLFANHEYRTRTTTGRSSAVRPISFVEMLNLFVDEDQYSECGDL